MTPPAGIAEVLDRVARVDPASLDRDDARRDALVELSRPDYDAAQPPLLFRLLGRALRELGELLGRAAERAPGGRLGLLLLVGLAVLTVAVLVTRLRPRWRESRSEALFGVDAVLTAGEHRARAEAAAAAGRYDEAVRERLRAVVRELESRGVLDSRAGRTAGEVARDGGAAVPAIADDLRRAAHEFDEVWYGGRPATAAGYALLVDVDRAVSGARLVTT